MLYFFQSIENDIQCFVVCIVAGCEVKFLIDSGSPINTITELDFERIKALSGRIYKVRSKCDREYRSYAGSAPLSVIKVFEAFIQVDFQRPKIFAQFFVIANGSKSLLSKRTAEELKLLKIGLDVASIEEKQNPFPCIPNIMVQFIVDKTVSPKKTFYYRVPLAMEEVVNRKLKELERLDIIEKVEGSSEWISSMEVVPKGDDDVRICVNMKAVNKAIKREPYPMPIMENFTTKLTNCTYFSKIDITNAYHHVLLHPSSRPLTTFMTSNGLMRYKRLMFGVNAAPELFQRIMDELLYGCEGCLAFIDDILIYGRSKKEHDERLNKVLSKLIENNIQMNNKKCLFGVSQLEFLGFTLTSEGVKPSISKIQAIKNFREPNTVEEVRSFLGLVNFVGHFISDLATKSEPLRKIIRGETKIWSLEQHNAFKILREDLIHNTYTLGYFDNNQAVKLFTDASPVGLGAVLVQIHGGKNRIIAFASKALTDTERRYPQVQREALAIVWAVERFYYYLFGRRFTIFVDNRAASFIFDNKLRDNKRACTRADGWALRLQAYRFDIQYISGVQNIADILSRLCIQKDEPYDESALADLCAISDDLDAITINEVKKTVSGDDTSQSIIKALNINVWGSDLIPYQAFKQELAIREGIITRGDRIVLPQPLRSKALAIAHRGHPGIVSMKRILRENLWWPAMDKDIELHIKACFGCTVVSKTDPPIPMIRSKLPEAPWQQLAIDFVSFPEHNITLLVLVDYYSRFICVEEMRKTNAEYTVVVLEQIFRKWSYPISIKADNGPPFDSKQFHEYCSRKNIKLINTIPYWPQMNGEVERQNRGIVRSLRIAKIEKRDWKEALNEYVATYNMRPHSITNKAPLEIMTGRPIKDLLPSLKDNKFDEEEDIRERDAIAKLKGKLYSDKRRHATKSEIMEGDQVLMLNRKRTNKLDPVFDTKKYEVIEIKGGDASIRSEDGVIYRRNISHLKKVHQDTTEANLATSNNSDTETIDVTPKTVKHSSDKTDSESRPHRDRKVPIRYTD